MNARTEGQFGAHDAPPDKRKSELQPARVAPT